MGVACSVYVVGVEAYTEFWWGNRRERTDNIKMDLQEVGCVVTDWIELVQDRDRLRALLNEVMNLRVPLNAGNFLTS
jgi:hypothetical protein